MLDIRKIIAATRDAIAETLYPTRCVACDEPGVLLCPTCENTLERIDLEIACQRCGAPFGRATCTECPSPGSTDTNGKLLPAPFAFDGARCACSYEGVCKRLLSVYKDSGEQRLAEHIARELFRVMSWEGSWLEVADFLVPIPPTPDHLRSRGWYPLGRIATHLEAHCDKPVAFALKSTKAADQRKLDREMRMRNRAGSFVLEEQYACLMEQHPTIVLIDDVLTTGATCDAAAHALKSAGAARVFVATYARVW